MNTIITMRSRQGDILANTSSRVKKGAVQSMKKQDEETQGHANDAEGMRRRRSTQMLT